MTAAVQEPTSMGFIEAVSYGFTQFCHGVEVAAVTTWPYIEWAAEKVYELWLFCLPGLEAAWAFLKSPPGITLTLLALTITFMKISQYVENEYVSYTFLALGVISGIMTGALMNQTRFLPQSFVQIFVPNSGFIQS